MGKRLFWTALSGLMVSAAHAAPPAPLPAQQLDWQPWGDQAPNGALCSGRYVEPGYRLSAGDTPRQVRTDSATAAYGDGGATVLAGEVVLRRDDTQLEAPRVRVNAERDRAFAEGPTAVRYPGLLVRGGDASMALDSDAAQVDNAHYVIHEQRVRGDAIELQRLPDGRYRLDDASFTTCEPGNRLWRMVGSDVTLDRAEGFGTATHARLEMGDVPVFYWPWLRFPIDDRRQSGFLWPTLGFSGDGLDYTQPYYLNLAPNYDATLSPRWMSEHGTMLGGEFRYLFGSDQGTIEGAYLASDKGGASDNPNDPDEACEDGRAGTSTIAMRGVSRRAWTISWPTGRRATAVTSMTSGAISPSRIPIICCAWHVRPIAATPGDWTRARRATRSSITRSTRTTSRSTACRA